MEDRYDGKEKSTCRMGLTCQVGEETTIIVQGQQVENKAEKVKIVISHKIIKTKAKSPAVDFSSCKPLFTLVISKSGINLHPLHVRKEVRGMRKALQNWFYFYIHRRPLQERGTAHHLCFHLAKVLAFPGPAVPRLLGGTLLGCRGQWLGSAGALC